MYSNQFPVTPKQSKPGHYKRVKVWTVLTNIGEFNIYEVDAKGVRETFSRLKPTATIISITRNS